MSILAWPSPVAYMYVMLAIVVGLLRYKLRTEGLASSH